MNRTRRAEIVRTVYGYAGKAVRDLADVDGGLYEGLADPTTHEGQEETALAVATIKRIAAMLDSRGS